MKIQVISPHFDDATLSCGEHLLAWAAAGHQIEVVTVFTEFSAQVVSPDSQAFMAAGGMTDPADFARQRRQEDQRSLKLLGVRSWQWLGLVDAGFRQRQQHPSYASHAALFARQITDDPSWQQRARRVVHQVLDPQAMIGIPLGVGFHVDHLLVNQWVPQWVPAARLFFYLDQPYALQAANWSWSQWRQIWAPSRSLKWSSPAKLQAVAAYTSQVPVLFPFGLWSYPECVLGGPDHVSD